MKTPEDGEIRSIQITRKALAPWGKTVNTEEAKKTRIEYTRRWFLGVTGTAIAGTVITAVACSVPNPIEEQRQRDIAKYFEAQQQGKLVSGCIVKNGQDINTRYTPYTWFKNKVGQVTGHFKQGNEVPPGLKIKGDNPDVPYFDRDKSNTMEIGSNYSDWLLTPDKNINFNYVWMGNLINCH